MQIKTISKLDLLLFIEEALGKTQMSFKDFVDDTRSRGMRDVFYIYIIRDVQSNKIMKEGRLNITLLCDDLVRLPTEAEYNDVLINVGRTVFLAHAVQTLVNGFGQDVYVVKEIK